MPKKPPRNNPKDRDGRTVQSAASLLRRISQKSGAAPLTASKAQAISALARHRAQLPEALQPHLIEVMEKPGEIVLFADSAAWAARIRLALADTADATDPRRITLRLIPAGGFRK